METQHELYHIGVLGMKWGVRKKVETSTNTRKDAFVLKKGTTIHRTTYNQNEVNKGHAYATFKPKDAKGYAFRQKLFSGGKITYDMSMKAKENLISPSKKERVETFVNLMLKDPDFVKAHQTQKAMYTLMKTPEKKTEIEQNIKKLQREYEMFAVELGGNETLRQKYFAELNKKGYNMIIDDADAAVVSNSPIVIFDRGKSLEIVQVNTVNREYLKTLGKSTVEYEKY